MNTEVKERSQDRSVEASTISNGDFNFDRWAKEVRTQLVAAIQRRSKRATDE